MPRRLLAVIPTLRGGGAERVMAGLCSAIATAGHEVTVLTFFPVAEDDYPLEPRCERESLGLGFSSTKAARAALNNWSRFRGLRRRIRALRPDTVLSFIDNANVLTILAAAGLGVRVVVSERIDPRVHPIPRPWPFLRRLTYPFADTLVVQTEAVAEAWARPLVGVERTCVIPNLLVLRPEASGPSEPGHFIVAAGRLEPQKGFDTLIRAYASAVTQGVTDDLVILGEGPQQAELRALAASLGVGTRVRLPGRASDMARWFRGARAFVLSSRYEGFPNVLLEALAFGLPCVATDCPSGPSELLAGGAGLLVPVDDASRLAAAMLTVSRDERQRAILSSRAKSAAARYSVDTVIGRWSTVLGVDE